MGPAVIASGILTLVMAFVCAAVATRKGYSYFGFFVIGLLFWPVALIVALAIRNKSELITVGSTVKIRNKIQLDDGSAIPAGFCSVVSGLDVIDGTPVIEVSAPDGSKRWIGKGNAVPA